MAIQGFDPKWKDLPDYILGITHEIWEQREIGRNDSHQPHRAAVRWSLQGKHSGVGNFGKLSGADVYTMGFTQVEFDPWGLKREYTLFDEILVWKQVLLHSGGIDD